MTTYMMNRQLPQLNDKMTTLPPLSSILHSSIENKENINPNQATFTESKSLTRLPPINAFTTSAVDASSVQVLQQPASIVATTPAKNPNRSFLDQFTPKKQKTMSSAESKSYAFISHSPATFPLQEPAIDNVSLARRKRRRTSPTELSILQREFEKGNTPNKLRRQEIAARVNMTEKAVQIWFQNRRQTIRKQSQVEKEVTELSPTNSTHDYSQDISHNSIFTPTKPVLNKSNSFSTSPLDVSETSPIKRSSSFDLHLASSPEHLKLPRTSITTQPPMNAWSTPIPNKIQFKPIITPEIQSNYSKKPINQLSFRLSDSIKESTPIKSKLPNFNNLLNDTSDKSECVENLLSLRGGQWK